MREIGKVISYDELKDGDVVLMTRLLTLNERNDMIKYMGSYFTVKEQKYRGGRDLHLILKDSTECDYTISFENGKCLTYEHLELVLTSEKLEEAKFKLGDRVKCNKFIGSDQVAEIVTVIQRYDGYAYDILASEGYLVRIPEKELALSREIILRTNLSVIAGIVYNESAYNDERANIELTFDSDGKTILKAEIL